MRKKTLYLYLEVANISTINKDQNQFNTTYELSSQLYALRFLIWKVDFCFGRTCGANIKGTKRFHCVIINLRSTNELINNRLRHTSTTTRRNVDRQRSHSGLHRLLTRSRTQTRRIRRHLRRTGTSRGRTGARGRRCMPLLLICNASRLLVNVLHLLRSVRVEGEHLLAEGR